MISDKIKALLIANGLKSKDLAAYLGMSPQSLQNKYQRESFSIQDLIKIADFTGSNLQFKINNNDTVSFSPLDLEK